MPVRSPRSVCLFLLLFSLAGAARAGELTAEEIARKSRETQALSLVGARAEIRLAILDAGGGAPRERLLTALALARDGEMRRLVRFLSPAEVAGVAFLSVEKPGAPAERFLYLPSQRRVRRVAQNQGGQSFMSTDFAYADLDLGGGGEERHERLPDAKVEGQDCYVIASTEESSPYGKVVSSVHKATFVPLRVEFFGKDGAHLKTLSVKRVKQVKGRWVAMASEMRSVSGSATSLEIVSLELDAAIDPEELTERALRQ